MNKLLTLPNAKEGMSGFGFFNIPIHVLERRVIFTSSASYTVGGITEKRKAWDAIVGKPSRHLVVMHYGRSDNTAALGVVGGRFQINGDTNQANYFYQYCAQQDGTFDANQGTNWGGANWSPIPGDLVSTTAGGCGFTIFPDAFRTTSHKSYIAINSSGGLNHIDVTMGRWASTSPIDSFLFDIYHSSNYEAGFVLLVAVVDERYCIGEALPNNSTISFSGIPATAKNLAFVASLRGTTADVTGGLNYEINDDTTAANYDRERVWGSGAGEFAQTSAASLGIGALLNNNGTASVFTPVIMTIQNYNQGTNLPQVLSINGYHSPAGTDYTYQFWHGRHTAGAATKVEFYPAADAFLDGSIGNLYLCPHLAIQTVELAEDAPSVTLTIPSDLDFGEINIYARSDVAAATDTIVMTINGDTTDASYDGGYFQGSAAVASAANITNSRAVIMVNGDTATANTFGGGIIFFGGSSSAKWKKGLFIISGSQQTLINVAQVAYQSATPMTSITFTLTAGTNFKAGTYFELSGIRRQEV